MKRNHESIGRYIRQCREKSGRTQAEIAKALGYSTAQFVSNWERGLSVPPFAALPRLNSLIRLNVKNFINLYVAETGRMIRSEMTKARR